MLVKSIGNHQGLDIQILDTQFLSITLDFRKQPRLVFGIERR